MSTFPHFATIAAHVGQEPEQWNSLDIVPPISMTSTFIQEEPDNRSEYFYSRVNNPTRQCVEKCIAALEGGKHGILFASGMAATHSITMLLEAGDHLVRMDDVYGGTSTHLRQFAARMGINVSVADFNDTDAVEKTVQPQTRLVWMETPTNPCLQIIDLDVMVGLLRKKAPSCITVLDNTFSTPYFQRPLDFGVDIVMHSVTKYMNGHADVLMGAAVTNDDQIAERLRAIQNVCGSIPSPIDCFLVNRGLKTLHLRMKEHMKNGLAVAKFLEGNPRVEKVLYPGLPSHPQHELAKKQMKGYSGMVTFYIKGGLKEAKAFIKALKIVRTYRSKTDRGNFGTPALRAALEAIHSGTSLKAAARNYGVPAKTLRRHRDLTVSQPGVSKLGSKTTVFKPDYELLLVEHIQSMEKALFGLTTIDVRRLAYDLAVHPNIKNHPFQGNAAGIDWLKGFMKRHQNLANRAPEATSVSRAVGFNRPQVVNFYQVYKESLDATLADGLRIWNMDETGISTVHKPVNIIASKGVRSVGKVTSGESGQTITVICSMNAVGTFAPPEFIYPRKRMVPSLMNGAPAGALGLCSPSGWTDSHIFLHWLEHFTSFVKCMKDSLHILLPDGHHSHKTLGAVLYAREKGIVLITFPLRCTHRLQSLDVTLFKALKRAFNLESGNWMTCNPGRRISAFGVVTIFSAAYNRSASLQKVVTGFEACGLWPFNPKKFTDDDFAPSMVTDEPQPVSDRPNSCQQALPMSSQLIESNKTADNLSVTGCIDISEGSGDAETSVQEDKTADTKSFGIPIVIAGGAGDTETSNEGNRSVDDQSLSNVMITSDNAKTLTEPSKTVEFLLTGSSPDNQQTHHSAIIVEETGDQKMFDEAILAGRTESATLRVSHNECKNADDSAFMNILLKLSPKPRISSQRTRKRKAESAMNLTSSPYKKMLIDK